MMRLFASVIMVVIILSSFTDVYASNVKGFWMSSPEPGSSICEVIRYEVNLGSSWPDDLRMINYHISMASIRHEFSNLTQLEESVNAFLREANVGDRFRIVDVERIDLLNP